VEVVVICGVGLSGLGSKIAPALASLSTGPQVLPGTCFIVGFSWGHSLVCVHPPDPAWGPPWAAGGDLLHRGLPCAAGAPACLSMVFSMACRGISALAPGAPPPPPSSLTLVSAELFDILSLSSAAVVQGFLFPLLIILSQRCHHRF